MYTVHYELTDGTLCEAHAEHHCKSIAIRIAKTPFTFGPAESGIARAVVCKGEMTVTTFENKKPLS